VKIAQIESNLESLVKSFTEDSFIYDLLSAYGLPKAAITRLRKGNSNLSKKDNVILWKKKLYFEVNRSDDLHHHIDELVKNGDTHKHSPRFIIVTDFKTILSVDTQTGDSLDVEIERLDRHYEFFLPWAGMEKSQLQNENPADIKAAERMAKLYDEIRRNNPDDSDEFRHDLNVFMARLLFCFFAEDTGIFEDNIFTNAVGSHTQSDGSDLDEYLNKLFEVLNTEEGKRNNFPDHFDVFPYVNGGLFSKNIQAPRFNKRSREMLIDSGVLDWASINPDIFGSMMQAVVTAEDRSSVGMHYTSVVNIMKVIEPLFLNDLHEEFDKAKGSQDKLNKLLARLSKIKVFDPACGSGNFLIIAYKELRRLEMKILKESGQIALSNISLDQFYGIEIEDFSHEIAILSLWLAKHQMSVEFFAEFGRRKPILPLKSTGNIIKGNACRIDWEDVCPKVKDDEIYILGNPPYLGQKKQDKSQKQDIVEIFRHLSTYKTLDYISIWFYKASKFMMNTNNIFCAFVSTNSICQSNHVSSLWPSLLEFGIDIFFCVKDFKWTNSAKNNAGVVCVIVGITNSFSSNKKIYTNQKINSVKNISPYLIDGNNTIVKKVSRCISNLPEMVSGNMALDDGHLMIETIEERVKIINSNQHANRFIRETTGGREFLHDEKRWCLWIEDIDLEIAKSIELINEKIEACYSFRINGGNVAKGLAYRAHQFRYRHISKLNQLIIPQTTSENREYVPIGFLEKDIVVQQSAQVIYDPEVFVFSILNSRIHLLWVKIIGGKQGLSIRYSPSICYNTFPFPKISKNKKEELNQLTFNILEEREKHSDKTLAQLYDPDKMPEGLKEAHRLNDLAVERCYRPTPFNNDDERLQYLFSLYEKMIEIENSEGTLFAEAAQKKRKRRIDA